MSDDLTRAMRATAENLTPDIGRLTAGGVERGVRKRRARRISQIAGAAASVTAVFGVVAAVAPGSHDAPASAAAGVAPGAVAATSPAAPASTHSAAVGATPTQDPSTAKSPSASPALPAAIPPQPAPSAPPVSGEDMVKLLKEQIAGMGFSSVTVLNKADTKTAGGPFAVLKVSFSAGQGDVSVSLEDQAWGNVHYGSPLPKGVTIHTLADGSHVVIYNGLQWPAGNGDPSAKRLDATWYRNDGVAVNVEAINEVVEKGATTATAVPLTPDQAEKIATASVWDAAAKSKAYQGWLDYQSAMAANGKPVSPNGSTPAGSGAH
ncbi:hypothetical protein [Catenulispora subtropica]|uniref:Uncharacterized protein n=1 Tax=Catenulispora subtropica TaxID=450798 RepID=A0ABN2RNI7_9ACTN